MEKQMLNIHYVITIEYSLFNQYSLRGPHFILSVSSVFIFNPADLVKPESHYEYQRYGPESAFLRLEEPS